MSIAVNYDNFLIREIDALGSDYFRLAEAETQIQEELDKFKEGKLTDMDYQRQLREALDFVKRRKARIPYEPGD